MWLGTFLTRSNVQILGIFASGARNSSGMIPFFEWNWNRDQEYYTFELTWNWNWNHTWVRIVHLCRGQTLVSISISLCIAKEAYNRVLNGLRLDLHMGVTLLLILIWYSNKKTHNKSKIFTFEKCCKIVNHNWLVSQSPLMFQIYFNLVLRTNRFYW